MPTQLSSLRKSLESFRVSARQDPQARCELCSAPLASEHSHLLDLETRRLTCACEACGLLFSSGSSHMKYRRVPKRIRVLGDFRLTDAQWDELLLPINVAFFHRNSVENRIVALYPSAAGATESLLRFDAWSDIVAANPILETMEPDVEAWLVDRLGHAPGDRPPEYFLAPIDQCYRLVGAIRTHWRGLSGGKQVWNEIHRFFSELRERATSGGGPQCRS